ncbi:MAG: hypothetical protein Tsb0015_05380 [Simkaniaceae bacterium]
MTATPTYTEAVLELGQKKSNRFIEKCCYESAWHFKKVLRNHTIFHFIFFALILLETSLFFFFISIQQKNYFIPITLAGIFLTFFSYLVLIYYFQAKKPEQFLGIKNSFLKVCKQTLDVPPASSDYHLSLAGAFEKLASFLEKNLENQDAANAAESFKSFLLKKFRYLIKKDIVSMKELLILESVREHILLIKKEPTDLEAHASLALTYLSLAKVYKTKNREAFCQAIERAVEELKILKDYVPTDPWVHAQLASCYHDLEKTEEEIKEYELILQLRPDDKEIMYRLGILYFQQGQNAKGLKIYDQLKNLGHSKADYLLNHYDAFTKSVFPHIS